MIQTNLLLAVGVTFLATSLGALPAAAMGGLSGRKRDLLLGLSAGVMLAATSFSLLQPALDLATVDRPPLWGASLVALALLMGAALIHAANQMIPHEHFFRGQEGKNAAALKRIWLFILAITIHNIPEGLAVGVTSGSEIAHISLPVLLGIGFQDIPEGLVVAMALLANGYRTRDSIFVAVVTGAIEALGAVVGYFFVQVTQGVLPWTLAFSGGMMLYVISHEMIPEFHSRGFEKEATFGLMVGFALMMILDVALK
jgi:ZIP family zinc transporter